MSDMKHECKSNLSTPFTDAAETGERVHLESTSRSILLPVIPESIPEDIKTLQHWVGWEAAYRPAKNKKKPYATAPKNPETGCNANPTTRRTWGAFDQAIAYHIIVDPWRQWILRAYRAETEGLSRQEHVIPARGGLSHG